MKKGNSIRFRFILTCIFSTTLILVGFGAYQYLSRQAELRQRLETTLKSATSRT
jgi:hypothetical protein